MSRVTLEDAQRRLPELIAQAIPGEEIEIIDNDRTIARLVRVVPPVGTPRFGSARGSILYMADDFDAPLEEFKEYVE